MEYADHRFFVGINGGHHRSTVVAYDAVSEMCYADRGKPLNFHNVNLSEVGARLSKLMYQIAARTDNSTERFSDQIEELVIALPGAVVYGDEPDLSELASDLVRDDSRWHIVDDTWAGLYAEVGATRGICAYASAGASVCVAEAGFVSDKVHKIDGWGPGIGDFGSAFEMSLKFFRRLGRQLDGKKPTPLFDEVKHFVNSYKFPDFQDGGFNEVLPELTGVDQVQEWFDDLPKHFLDREWRAAFSLLATPILDCADADRLASHEARELVKRSAKAMSKSIRLALSRLSEGNDDIPIILQGGLFRQSRTYRQAVHRSLAKIDRSATAAKYKPVVGSLMLAADAAAVFVENKDEVVHATDAAKRMREVISKAFPLETISITLQPELQKASK